MKTAAAACLLLLAAGCEPAPTYRCINGALYSRGEADGPWRAVDGAPSHQGFTPVPCKPPEKGQ